MERVKSQPCKRYKIVAVVSIGSIKEKPGTFSRHNTAPVSLPPKVIYTKSEYHMNLALEAAIYPSEKNSKYKKGKFLFVFRLFNIR